MNSFALGTALLVQHGNDVCHPKQEDGDGGTGRARAAGLRLGAIGHDDEAFVVEDEDDVVEEKYAERKLVTTLLLGMADVVMQREGGRWLKSSNSNLN